MLQYNLLSVRIEDIEYDETYKYSHGDISQELEKSISENGILNPLIVFCENGRFRIISGHNRYIAAVSSGCTDLKAIQINIEEFDFNSQILNRCYCGTISNIKKLKYISDFSVCDAGLMKKLGVPAFFSVKGNIEKALGFPKNLMDYLDIKDVNFRTIEKMCSLDYNNINILSRFVIANTIRLNVFREVVYMLCDFSRFGMEFDFADIEHNEVRKYEDEFLLRMKKVRYRKYFASLEKVDTIVEKYMKNGIEIGVPQYFEGNSIYLKFKLKNTSDIEKMISELEKIKKSDLDEIFGTL